MSNATTRDLGRLAVELDATDGTFDADTAEWLTAMCGDRPQSAALISIMNDATENSSVRSRAMAMLIADLLRP